jgi:valyl-tRNA synthetase
VDRQDPLECPTCHSGRLDQDPDVLDTWFSSGLWPFSTLGWPDETPDFKYFYPTSVLETGYDIIFFWVARMIMQGLEFTGQAPFHTVYLHGLIRDEHGQKMSKTKGNMIDPLIVMDELGTDALRFTLLVGSTPGNDMNLSVKKVEANRNFANKVWNAGRFVIGALDQAPDRAEKAADWSLADSWIFARLQNLVRDVDRLFTAYQYGEAGRQIYEFFWSEFADWYVEIAKLQLAEGGDRAFYTAQTLVRVLDACLRMLHPFTPFVTEELWRHLKTAAQAHSDLFTPDGGWEEALIVAHWPEPRQPEGWEEQKTASFNLVMEIVRAIRNLRSEKKLQPNKHIHATIVTGTALNVLQDQYRSIAALASLDLQGFKLVDKLPQKPTEGTASLVVSGVEIFLPLADLVDVETERARLQKELMDVQSQIERLERLLNSDFAQRAPAAVVEKERQKLVTCLETSQKIANQVNSLA